MWSLSYLASRLCAGADRVRTAVLAVTERLGIVYSLAIAAFIGGALFVTLASLTSLVVVFLALGFIEMLSQFHRKPQFLKPFHVELPSMQEVSDAKRVAGICAALFGGWVSTALVLQALRGEGP